MMSLMVSGVLALFALAHTPQPVAASLPPSTPVHAPRESGSSGSAALAVLIVCLAAGQTLRMKD